MKCLRCGHCCKHFLNVVIKDPNKPLSEANTILLAGTVCPHLRGNKPGKYACSIHGHKAYKGTPCADFTQIEHGNQPCRLGMYHLKGAEK